MTSQRTSSTLDRPVHHWTGRQREVLDLLARGRTNAQIADDLGVSLDGAKWHVREIMAELDAPTREDAAEYWRAYNGLPSRFGRLARALFGVSLLRGTAIAAGAVAAVGVAIAVTLVATGGGDDPSRSAGSDATQTPGASVTVAGSGTAAVGPNDPEGLQRHGVYRIVPANYAGKLPHATTRQAPSKGVASSDPTLLQSSTLYVVVPVPNDMTRTEIDTYDGDSNTVIRQAFAGVDIHRRTLQVTRVVRSDEPIDVYEPPKDSAGWLQLSASFIEGHEAVTLTPTGLSPIPEDARLVRVQFFSNGVETILTATGMQTAEVTAIADQIAKAEGR